MSCMRSLSPRAPLAGQLAGTSWSVVGQGFIPCRPAVVHDGAAGRDAAAERAILGAFRRVTSPCPTANPLTVPTDRLRGGGLRPLVVAIVVGFLGHQRGEPA